MVFLYTLLSPAERLPEGEPSRARLESDEGIVLGISLCVGKGESPWWNDEDRDRGFRRITDDILVTPAERERRRDGFLLLSAPAAGVSEFPFSWMVSAKGGERGVVESVVVDLFGERR